MSLLALSALTLTRGDTLFAGLDLTIARGDRIGLVAANGRGKSSLLRLLAGGDEATSGTLTRGRGCLVALVPQDPPEELLPLPLAAVAASLLDAETAETESWRAEIAMDDLEIPRDLRERPLGALSGGWQRMALLARAAVLEPDLLLLDEPTNHLDLARIGLVQRWLAALPNGTAVLAASHDRAFLDAVTTRTLFLRPETSAEFALPYSAARGALDERDAAADRAFANEMKKVKQLRQQAAKLKNIGINSGSDLLVTKTKQLTDRAAKLEEAARPAHQERSAGAIRLTNSGTHARALLSFEETEIAAPDGRVLFRLPRMWVEQGDRVALLGPNGAGKTRLMDRVTKALAGGDPAIRPAASVVAGVSDQALDQLAGFDTPWEVVSRDFDHGDARSRAMLASAGIVVDLQRTPLSRLSGGQLARLALLRLRLERPNLYLLDEPTNHLDIEGQEALETELLEQGATALLVSHDRAFFRAVATRVWVIDGKRLVEVDDPDPVFDRLMDG
ncbi:ATP-binding cassette domain-containing protein [Wenxinia marina]|uniref:ATPase component of ABC transporter with duplicated ATPase domain protein n=1 Tax=Wenxinia marina DSM 24838 TaxID=1123501 RepID=A0A0D0QG90_9RHOB|nr:ATP-binding cassette domain-containing protein [Wenxinia marina]KIQ71272.1 ATPase component of ABC transporter with duplicated ATPase domain protein [Wenxinia marina DSM 24838]GGL73437.1 ABC transporter [Wenxinia marina]